jgi:glutaconate CoA-transferase subunit B
MTAEPPTEPTPVELMTIAGSRLLRDGRVVFAGVGAPLEASVLAKRLHAPSLTIVLEGGSIGPRMLPGRLPVSTNEMRAAHDAFMLTSINELFLYGQRGYYDYGFIGAGQLDQYGNVNTSYIGDPDHPKVRLPGSGGANDIVSSCREVMIMTRHEPRRFVERVDFITSPGYLSGPESRRAAGLVRNRPVSVITDLALLGFDELTGRLRLDALQPGVTEADVHANTSFELLVSDTVAELAAPTEQELAELRWLRDGEQSNTAPRREVTSAP